MCVKGLHLFIKDRHNLYKKCLEYYEYKQLTEMFYLFNIRIFR